MKKRPVADGEDVGVEGAGVDAVGVLLREEAARGRRGVQARERRGWPRASAARDSGGAGDRAPGAAGPRRRRARRRRRGEARVVGGAFVGELPAAGQRVVHDEAPWRRRRSARRTRVVVGASMARWNICWRFGGREMDRARPRCRDEGATVAAFAVHIADALRARGEGEAVAGGRGGDDLLVGAAEAEAAQGREAGPVVRRKHRLATPRSRTKRIFARPCCAAARGFDASPPWLVLATLPGLEPAVVVGRTDEAVELDARAWDRTRPIVTTPVERSLLASRRALTACGPDPRRRRSAAGAGSGVVRDSARAHPGEVADDDVVVVGEHRLLARRRCRRGPFVPSDGS